MNRWYIYKDIEPITKGQVKTINESSIEKIMVDSEETVYYQIINSTAATGLPKNFFPTAPDAETETDKPSGNTEDPEIEKYILERKKAALGALLTHGGQNIQEEETKKLIEKFAPTHVYVTGGFYIPPGPADLIKFQLIIRSDTELYNAIRQLLGEEVEPAKPEEDEAVTVTGKIKFRADKFLKDIVYVSEIFKTSFNSMNATDLETPYDYNYELSGQNLSIIKLLVEGELLTTKKIVKYFRKGKWLPRKKINLSRYDIRFAWIGTLAADQPTDDMGALVMKLDESVPITIHQKNKKKVLASLSSKNFNEKFDSETLGVLINLEGAAQSLRENEAPVGVDLEEFTNQYIIPNPSKEQKPVEVKKVFNKGAIKYKSKEELETERLTDRVRNKIFKKVKNEFLQVGDQAFLEILKNRTNIKSIEDIYNQVLKTIPVDALLDAAAECLLKSLPITDLKKKVCDIVLGDLQPKDLNKILKYMGTNTTKETKKVKQQLIQITKKNTGNFKGVRSEIIQYIKKDVTARDVLCLAIFAAIPAAIALLSKLSPGAAKKYLKEQFEKQRKIAEIDLNDYFTPPVSPPAALPSNPAKLLLEKFEMGLDAYNITSLTGDWASSLKVDVTGLVENLVVDMVKILLEQVSYMCDGSSASDFAGFSQGYGSDGIPPYVDPVFPFVPYMFNDLIDDPMTYGVLGDALPMVTQDEITDFLDALSEFLTISEICTLINGGPNANLIIENIYAGMFKLERFKNIASALKNRSKFVKFIELISKNVDKGVCVRKLDQLTKTKKILAEFCGPSSNGALVEDLKRKASDAVIENFLNQENEMANRVLNAIMNLSDFQRIADKAPPIFCGPATPGEEDDKEPILKAQQHPSQKHTNRVFMDRILKTIDNTFEQDLMSYKPILAYGGNDDKMKKAVVNASKYQAKIYGLDGFDDINEAEMNQLVAENSIIAAKVYNTFIDKSLIHISSKTNDSYLKINRHTAGDFTQLRMNFSDKPQYSCPPASIQLEFGQPGNLKKQVKAIEVDQWEKISANFIPEGGIGLDLYDLQILDKITAGLPFYASILEQVIQEHAEYITTQDLFKKTNFDKLELNKRNPICPSLLDYKQAIIDLEKNAKELECKIDFAATPSASDVAQLNSFIEIAVKVVVIREFLKSLLVFSSFGIKSLLPTAEGSSFYYGYVENQVAESLGQEWKELIKQYSQQAYGAASVDETIAIMVGKHFKTVQAIITEKLNAIGLNTGNTLEKEYNLDAPPTDQDIKQQILNNIILDKVLDPPEILAIDFKNKKGVIPKKYYSNHERLKNGGFFIEQGFDVRHKYAEDVGVITKEEMKALLKAGDSDFIDKVKANKEKLQLLFGYAYGYEAESGFPYGIGAFKNTLKAQSDSMRYHVENNIANNIAIDKQLLEWEGRLSKAKYWSYGAMLKYWGEIDKPAVQNKFTPNKVDLNNSGFFKKMNQYITLNILIPVSTDNHMVENRENLKDATQTEAFNTGFLEGVFDRKYFLQEAGENDSGQKWFKLPLVEIPLNKNASNKTVLELFDDNFTPTPPYTPTSFYDEYKNMENLFRLYRSSLIGGDDEEGSFQQGALQQSQQFTETAAAEGGLDENAFANNNVIAEIGSYTDEEGKLTPSEMYSRLQKTFRMAENAPFPPLKTKPDWWPETIGNNQTNLFENKYEATVQAFLDFKSAYESYTSFVKSRICWSTQFADFAENIQYKELLSFLAIMTAEQIETEYPELKPMFNKTLLTIAKAIQPLITAANRHEDPEFYQKMPKIADLEVSASGPNWYMIILEVMMKMLANQTDPTWRTPWFWPGPLNSVGIVAKILDAIPDENSIVSINNSSEAYDEIEKERKENLEKSLICSQDSNSE